MEHEEYFESDLKPRWMTMPPGQIDSKIVSASLTNYERNNLFLFICTLIGENEARNLFDRFQIGTSDHWNGGTILWQIDRDGETRLGVIKLFDPITGRPKPETSMVHQFLGLYPFSVRPALFGEHQLKLKPDAVVAIVEDEITALIATAFYPDYVWLASGEKRLSLDFCQFQRLSGRNIVVYPNLSSNGMAFNKWNRIVREIQLNLGCQIVVSTYLEDNASDEERAAGFSIAHFLMRDYKPVSESVKEGSARTEFKSTPVEAITLNPSLSFQLN
ncbi:hypothetical protein GCM10028805_27410 [Spirosoma harenae]